MNAEITQLFSVPMYRSRIILTENDINNVKMLDYFPLDKENGYGSSNTSILEQSCFMDLKTILYQHLNDYCDILKIQDNLQFYITNSWSTLHKLNDGSRTHSHRNSLISGILYIQCDENSGQIGFEKDLSTTTIFPHSLDIQFKESNLLNMKHIMYKPCPGDLLIFPSFLQHWVTPSSSDQDRYVVAFNVFVKGTIGSGGTSSIDTIHIS